MGLCRRFAVYAALVTAMVLGPIAMVTVGSPAVSWACDWGQYWDPGSNSCLAAGPPPPPPPVGPVTMCIGAPVPFVPLSWCFPVGQT
jgi:hypothetical protein